jgi:hypothetical protein
VIDLHEPDDVAIAPPLPPALGHYHQPIAPRPIPVAQNTRPPWLAITAIASGAVVVCTYLITANSSGAIAARQTNAFAAFAIEQAKHQARPNVCVSFVCPPAAEPTAVAPAAPLNDPYTIAKNFWANETQHLSTEQLQRMRETGAGCATDASCQALWDVLAEKGV